MAGIWHLFLWVYWIGVVCSLLSTISVCFLYVTAPNDGDEENSSGAFIFAVALRWVAGFVFSLVLVAIVGKLIGV